MLPNVNIGRKINYMAKATWDKSDYLEPVERAKQELADRAASRISEENLTDVRFYMRQLADISQKVRLGESDGLEAGRMQKYWSDLYEEVNGVPLKTASQGLRNPIERLSDTSVLEHEEDGLNKLEAAIKAIPGLQVSKKKRWLKVIERTRKLQKIAKSSAIAMWTYVGRTSETAEIFQMQEIQARFFRVWNDNECPHSLIMAPPGHSKTTCLRGQVIWDIANNPSLRILILYDAEMKALKEIPVLKTIIRGSYFQALYPHVRVLGRDDDAEDSRRRFTVLRPNTGSREPTVEGAGIKSRINGNGYDMILIDDPCPEEVARQPALRDDINERFLNVVEQRLRNPLRSNMRMVCTPWHEMDLAGMIQRQVSEGQREGWKISIDEFRVKDDLKGKPISLWPETFPSKYYEMERRKLNPNTYARLYLLKCQSDDERLVNKLQFYAAEGLDSEWCMMHPETREAHLSRLAEIANGEQWLSIDPSATSGRYSSETAATQISITVGGQAYVREAWFFPGNPTVMQEWIVQKIIKENIAHVLCEAQGGIKGQVILWEEFVYNRLKELGFKWTGSFHKIKTQGAGGGQLIGKRQRLKNASGYLQNGFIKFPGRLTWNLAMNHGKGAMEYICSRADTMQKLTNQIINFPMGTSDGVDTITQFLIYNESRLVLEGALKVLEEEYEYENTMRTGLLRSLAELRNPKPESSSEEEETWIRQRFG